MKPMLLAASLAMIASQASALSCLAPDPIRTFQRLAAAPEPYFVLHGKMTFDEAALPIGLNNEMARAPELIPATMHASGLTQQGFTDTFVRDVTLQVGCAGPWCGTATSDIDALFFVAHSPPPVIINADPCGGMIFEEPTQAVLDMITSCVQGLACTPLPLQ